MVFTWCNLVGSPVIALPRYGIYGQLNLNVAIFRSNAPQTEANTAVSTLDFKSVLEEPDDYLHEVYWENCFQPDPMNENDFDPIKNRGNLKKLEDKEPMSSEIARYFYSFKAL